MLICFFIRIHTGGEEGTAYGSSFAGQEWEAGTAKWLPLPSLLRCPQSDKALSSVAFNGGGRAMFVAPVLQS